MLDYLKNAASKFLENSEGKTITIISHYDTDGITSAAIMAQALKRLKKRFFIKIVKHLTEETFNKVKGDIIIFLDLGSSFLDRIAALDKDVFVLDHHEITGEIPENITVVNPRLYDKEEISAAAVTYLFCNELGQNKDLATLAVVGMVGDMLGSNLSKYYNEILKDADIKIKKGLILYPATRPIHKTLEYSSGHYIPGVTGDPSGVFNLLQEAGIKKENGNYKSLIELNKEEMSKLITGILLRKKDTSDLIGNIYLVKFFNKLEDARELSAMINACSRLDNSDIAFAFCLNNQAAKKKAENIYAKYKQHLVKALKYAEQNKTEGRDYVIINAKNAIKDTIIGTVASIMSFSRVYSKGTIIVGLAYDKNKIKVSARVCGRQGRNVREVLESVTKDMPESECGGHPFAAGCLINKSSEKQFMDNLIKTLELEVVKI